MVTTQILLLAVFLSVTWGIYLLGTIQMYRTSRGSSRERIRALRRFIVALCIWLFVFSVVFRTACIVCGVGDETAGQIVFFALAGSNVVGSLFAAISLRYD